MFNIFETNGNLNYMYFRSSVYRRYGAKERLKVLIHSCQDLNFLYVHMIDLSIISTFNSQL